MALTPPPERNEHVECGSESDVYEVRFLDSLGPFRLDDGMAALRTDMDVLAVTRGLADDRRRHDAELPETGSAHRQPPACSGQTGTIFG